MDPELPVQKVKTLLVEVFSISVLVHLNPRLKKSFLPSRMFESSLKLVMACFSVVAATSTLYSRMPLALEIRQKVRKVIRPFLP